MHTSELERLHEGAFGWALSCCGGDRVAAEDAVQTSYLKILEGRARFDGRSSLRTWLFGVVRRTAAELRRRARISRWVPLMGIEIADGRPDPAAAFARSESTRALEAALHRLPRRQREVLHLVFYQNLTVSEAAEVMGVRVGTGRTHYERGKAALRRVLEA